MFHNVLKSALDAAKVCEWEKFIKRPKGDYFDQSNQGHVIKYMVELWRSTACLEVRDCHPQIKYIVHKKEGNCQIVKVKRVLRTAFNCSVL